MYIPPAFEETDLHALHAFIERHSFGLLVSQQDGAPLATHMPFLLERESGQFGVLLGHVARANPQWRQCGEQTVMAVFSGPHAYVSPTWYEAEQVVPTWNYAAVHVYGRAQAIDDPPGLYAIVRRSVDTYERSLPKPWALGERDTFIDRLLLQIVGIRLEIERIEGKFKLSQNHPAERREKVMRALAAQNNEDSRAIAELMRERD